MLSETDDDSVPTSDLTAEDTRRYVVGECVGRGGLGSVHRAWDSHLGRWVAVKRLTATGNEPHDPEDAGERLRREASALAAFQHPHIVTVHDFGADEEGPFVVMEFIEGETLDAVATRAPLDLDSFGTLAVQTLGAVEAAHRAGLLHRDLKPGNLMLAGLPDGGFTVKVLDFGLAKFAPRPAPQTLDQGNALLGSIYYMAPEQFRGEPIDVRTDLYALGAIFYFGLTGRHPFDGDTTAEVMAAHLEGRVLRPLSHLRPDVSPPLAAWVERLMSRDPSHRPSSAAAALAFVRPLLAGVTVPGDGRARTGRVPVLTPSDWGTTPVHAAPAARSWLWPAASVAMLLGAGGFFAFRLLPPSPPSAAAASNQPGAPRVAAAGAPAAVVAPPASVPAPTPVPAASPAPAAPTPAPAAPTEELALESTDVAGIRAQLGKVVTVTGTPVGVGQSRTGTVFYLNFSSRPHEGLAVVYFVNPGTTVSQEDLRAFVGKPVRVKGKVGDFKGDLQLVIQSPADIRAGS